MQTVSTAISEIIDYKEIARPVYIGQQIDLYPAHISGTQPRTNYQPLLVTGRDAKRVMRLVQADTRYDLNDFDEEKGFARQDYLPAE